MPDDERRLRVSEKYQTPVLMRPTTRVCHASTYFEVAEHTQARTPEGFKRDSRWVIFPKRSYAAHKEINERLVSIANDFSESEFDAFNPMFTEGEDAQFGIVAGGISYAYTREALRLLEEEAQAGKLVWAQGAPVAPILPPLCEGGYCTMGGPAYGKTVDALPAYRIMQVGTPYPFPQKRAVRFAELKRCDRVRRAGSCSGRRNAENGRVRACRLSRAWQADGRNYRPRRKHGRRHCCSAACILRCAAGRAPQSVRR